MVPPPGATRAVASSASAAAIYVPMHAGIVAAGVPGAAPLSEAAVVELAARFYDRMRREGRCQLQLALFAEDLLAPHSSRAPLATYPFNAMRNRALLMATTEAVLCLDIDMLVSASLAAEVSSSEGWAALQQQLDAGAAVVLPAFETRHDVNGQLALQEGRALAFEAAAGDKASVLERWHAGDVYPFKVSEYWPAYGPTDYQRFKGAADYYAIEYIEEFEPYAIMARRHTPWYDERFRRYGYDKAGHVKSFVAWGGRLVVHPRAFTVHIPHARSPSYNAAFRPQSEADMQRRAELLQLMDQMKAEVQAGSFLPVTAFAAERCMAERQLEEARLRHAANPQLQPHSEL
ncbi:hypothetical protein ABPG75_012290 [Micractinium tetrahymenae]